MGLARLWLLGHDLHSPSILEKSFEHHTKQFITFVDLRKAYNFVPHTALWHTLEKLGIPNSLVKQGHVFCTCLMGSCPGGANQIQVNDCQFADDAAILATSCYAAEQATLAYVDVAQAFGLTVSIGKTKLMVTGYGIRDANREPIAVGESKSACVDEFSYLGLLISSSGRVDAKIDRCIASASRAFGALRHAVFMDCTINTTSKRKVYQACVLPALLYECVLDPNVHTSKQDLCLSPSLHPHCTRNGKQSAMVATHYLHSGA